MDKYQKTAKDGAGFLGFLELKCSKILYLDSLRIDNINVPREGFGQSWSMEQSHCHLEDETKEGDANDRKKGQLPDAEKAKDCPEGSKEQQEGQPPAPAQSTLTQEEEAVRDYPFLARQATPSITKDVSTFNLGFDSIQETVEEVTITSEDYGSFTTEDYKWVGREANEAIALKSLKILKGCREK
ncbi:hypothetical protein E2562_028149 [Oryza meyeriana var. granulata]|uniref:Uncharacterized protein n=1 Tax=Oryza meyeriana var. granulata TaxID=110450 RepID=A0A6G1D8S4_9ORYZ|nr:hypothetical protein E2562_028149 [Oryza meyeriana var. granulata]